MKARLIKENKGGIHKYSVNALFPEDQEEVRKHLKEENRKLKEKLKKRKEK